MIARRTLLTLCGLASTGVGLACLVLLGGGSAGSTRPGATSLVVGFDVQVAPTRAPADDSEVGTRTDPSASRRHIEVPLRTLHLTLIERGTRRPLPQAVVHAWACGIGVGEQMSWLCEQIGPDFAAHVAKHGIAAIPDDEGTVDIAVGDEPVLVAARFEDLFALMYFDASDEGPQEMTLSPSHDLEVRVRDTHGRLRAGVKVGLGECRDSNTFWSDVTDANGTCRIHDIETVVDEGPSSARNTVAVRLAIPSTPAIEQWIDPLHLPDSPVELVLPATGALRMRVVDARGRVFPLDGSVRVYMNEIRSPGSIQPVITDSAAKVALVAGRAFAPHVTLGRELWVVADIAGTDEPSVAVVGPRFDGEIVDVDIPLDDDASFVCGRAVDEKGTPLARAALRWTCFVDDGDEIVDVKSSAIVTADDGRFALTLSRAIDAGARPARRTCHLMQSSTAPIRRQAVLLLPREFDTDVFELGDVSFGMSGPLVQGRAVDETGRGVRGVKVEAIVLTSSSPDRRAAGDYDALLDRAGSALPGLELRTAEDGTFALFGPCLDLRWALRIGGDYGKTPRMIPFACGSSHEPVQFVSPAACTLSGSALVDHEWNGGALGVRFIAAGDTEPYWAGWRRVGDRVLFRLEDVEPAQGKIEFTLTDTSTPDVLEVPDIQLVAGQDAHPQSLVDVDLRGKLPTNAVQADTESNVLDLEIVDERGAQVASGMAWVWRGGSAAVAVPWAAGHLRVEKDQIERVEVWSSGFRFHVFVPPISSQRIVLRPEIDLDITFVLPPELKGSEVALRGSIWFMTEDVDAKLSRVLNGESEFTLDATGKAHVRVSAAGHYAADLTVARRRFVATENDDGNRSVGAENPFVVRDVDGFQSITVTFNAAELATALKELGLSKE